MGRKTKLREAQKHAAEQALCARLREHSRTEKGPAFIGRYAEFALPYQHRLEAYRKYAVRDPEAWRCRLRVRAPEARFLDLVRFSFARFPVPQHLETAWTHGLQGCAAANQNEVAAPVAPAEPDFRHWYILTAQGQSLHREAACRYLTARETHLFLRAPNQVTSSAQALWYAIAKAATDDESAALRVARTKITDRSGASTFWKDVARFFARHPLSVVEMNDLLDFLHAAKMADARFSIVGRTLPALRRRMADWHRVLRAAPSVAGTRWDGRPIANSTYATEGEDGRTVWRFRQIKTGEQLFEEGERMHHCVVAYKDVCASGASSIWSLSRETPGQTFNRSLTIEMTRDGRIVQCRGFANRLPLINERAIVQRWADDNGLAW